MLNVVGSRGVCSSVGAETLGGWQHPEYCIQQSCSTGYVSNKQWKTDMLEMKAVWMSVEVFIKKAK